MHDIGGKIIYEIKNSMLLLDILLAVFSRVFAIKF